MEQKLNIYALIVTYNPQLENFIKNYSEIAKQVYKVIIVDNSTDVNAQLNIYNYFNDADNAILIQPKENVGIAYAQNIGFTRAINDGAKFLITFDQDSTVQDGLIEILYNEYKKTEALGIKVACIGPSVVNERNNTRYEKYFSNGVKITDTTYSVKSIISSGTLYNTDVFSLVGFNKSEWFIDSIDIEWCYRARYLGLHVIMTTLIEMKHNLGSHDVKLPFGKSINVGSAFRLYYVYRNWIFSLREPQFNFKYKLKLLIMMPLKFLIFINISPRRQRASFILKGLKDGVLKRHSFVEKKSTK